MRSLETGKVRMETGRSYMLKADEELWTKVCSTTVCLSQLFALN